MRDGGLDRGDRAMVGNAHEGTHHRQVRLPRHLPRALQFQRGSSLTRTARDPARPPFLTPTQRAKFDRERPTQSVEDVRARYVVALTRHVERAAAGEPLNRFAFSYALEPYDLREALAVEALDAGDPVALQRALRVCHRLNFLADCLRDSMEYAGCDCLHAWDMLDALGGGDTALFFRHVAHHPAETTSGHPRTRLLADALVALGSRDPARIGRVSPRLAAARGSGAWMALWSALSGIVDDDPARVSAALAKLTKVNAQLGSPVIRVWRYVALRAHAVHTLARLLMPPDVFARVVTPDAPPWWSDFASLPELADDAPLAFVLPAGLAGLDALVRTLPSRFTAADLAGVDARSPDAT